MNSDEFFGKQLSVYQRQIDAEAKRDAAIEHYKQAVHVTHEEVSECLSMMTDAEFSVFSALLASMVNYEPEKQPLTYFETMVINHVKHACRGVIQLKAEKMVEEFGL